MTRLKPKSCWSRLRESFRERTISEHPFFAVSAKLRTDIYLSLADSGYIVAEINTKSGRTAVSSNSYVELREAMVETQIRRRGVKDERVLRAMMDVPRHEFVPSQSLGDAYADEPLPIGGGQTISQPYIVAAMTEALELCGSEKVLEIGTGSGYQAAVLSVLSKEVYSIECRPELAWSAAERLLRLGFQNTHVHCGDGTLGLKEFAPYDAVLVAAAAPSLPEPLLEQLSEGGRIIAPIGTEEHQQLLLLTRHGNNYASEHREGCRFVPLVGRYGWKDWELF
jgi:protein-L-isoaspartate(D-aspartate) O-methyltransferase